MAGPRCQTLAVRTPLPAFAAVPLCRGVRRFLVDGGLGALDERGERGRIADGEVGEDLAVDLDARGVQAVDEPAVADAVLAAGGVDPLDPQPPEVALAGAAVAERVLQACMTCSLADRYERLLLP